MMRRAAARCQKHLFGTEYQSATHPAQPLHLGSSRPIHEVRDAGSNPTQIVPKQLPPSKLQKTTSGFPINRRSLSGFSEHRNDTGI